MLFWTARQKERLILPNWASPAFSPLLVLPPTQSNSTNWNSFAISSEQRYTMKNLLQQVVQAQRQRIQEPFGQATYLLMSPQLLHLQIMISRLTVSMQMATNSLNSKLPSNSELQN